MVYDVNGNALVEIDGTLTVSGAAADAKVTGDAVTELNSSLKAYIYGLNKSYPVTKTGTNKFSVFLIKGIRYTFTNNTSSNCTLRIYNKDDTNTLVSSAVTPGSSVSFTPNNDDAVQFGGWMSGTGTVELRCDFSALNDTRLTGIYNYTDEATWEIGSIYGETGGDYNEVTRGIRTPTSNKVYVPSGVVVSLNELVETVYAFKYNADGTYQGRLGTSGKVYVALEPGYYYRFLCLAKTGTVITTDTIQIYSADFFVCGSVLARVLNELYPHITYEVGYEIGEDLLRRDIKAERVGAGSLTYGQSFLIYNGKYYSTDGANIAVQNADFSVNRQTELSVGHGNSFQLGTARPNIGYVSGWDDNKVYCVNLDTLELDSTIELPTTGYTTCAVDDVNGIIYIFQRDTRPNTESIYNLIVYDYVNQNTIQTRKTTVPFGAMQACDIFHDRIIVLNGLGTSELPNGFRVYSTSGKILSDYFFPSFASIEPEGVFIDRNTGDMYISLVNARVYKISPV